ncbi:hypothetical protein GBF38_021795 [Nibea albiflora]|uniref:Uncharacterized protein n=1 Tax=Nibea albiflora TaxID=240163 RepID=A0ACB7FGR2_NIBAL|nr:hypothetical protein GBF38_021795 [Nibea albiflora]
MDRVNVARRMTREYETTRRGGEEKSERRRPRGRRRPPCADVCFVADDVREGLGLPIEPSLDYEEEKEDDNEDGDEQGKGQSKGKRSVPPVVHEEPFNAEALGAAAVPGGTRLSRQTSL